MEEHKLKVSRRMLSRRGAVAWMAGNSVVANLIMLVCLVGGLLGLSQIKKEYFPDTTSEIVQVSVPYPGASPEEVENGIILAVEEGVRGLDGVDEVISTASEGNGSVKIELVKGGDLSKLADDVKSAVDRITTFPDDAEEPRVSVMSRKRQVMSIVLYGDLEEVVLREVAELARDQFLQDPEITQLEMVGVKNLEISIEVSQENLRRYGLTMADISRKISTAAIELPGGGIKTSGGEILVRMKERREYGFEFAKLPVISNEDGTEVLLEDIAVIKDGFSPDSEAYALYNGKPAVRYDVYRIGDQTPLTVADAVNKQIEELNVSLPPGVQIAVLDSKAVTYKQRINLLLKNGFMGLALVLIVLGLFLEVRLAFWVMMGIPISFLGSFLFLPMVDVSLNMVSMFAYIIALGIVVDDAIVVGENIYHYHQEGMSFKDAALAGTREVAMPVTFSILTNLVTFMPLMLVPGTMGKIFINIPWVVFTVFIISLFESVFILPAHLGHQKERKRRGPFKWLHNKQQAFSHFVYRWIRNVYAPFLDVMLKWRYVMVAFGFAILVVMLTFAASGRMGFQMFPKIGSDFSQTKVVLPYGTAIEETNRVADQILRGAESVLKSIDNEEYEVGIFSNVASGGTHTITIRVYLPEPDVRERIMPNDEFTKKWRKATGPVVGVEFIKFESDAGGPGGGASLTVELRHRDTKILEAAASELAGEIQNYSLVKDVDDGFERGKRQVDFIVTPEGKSLGLTAIEIGRQVRAAFHGDEAIRQQRGRNELKVKVRLPDNERKRLFSLENMMIRTPAGTFVPLNEVAEGTYGRAYTTITRRNGSRSVQVSADVSPRSKSDEVTIALQNNYLDDFLGRYTGLAASFEGSSADRRESLGALGKGFLLAIVIVYVVLAIPFNSYIQPAIVMVSIPFGVVGALLGHLIMGYPLSLPSMFGVVALAGVVVNDSLVMIDFANREGIEGLNAHDSILNAGIQRFRPIVLTTLTTFGGLAPMILETSRQAKFLIPMAISLGFGILFATFITLLLVPCLYLIVDDVRKFLHWILTNDPPPPDKEQNLELKES